MASQEKVIPRTVSMYEEDWQIVEEADRYGGGTSATLRRIVREWDQYRRTGVAEVLKPEWPEPCATES